MKVIRYVLAEHTYIEKEAPYNEINLEIAKREAYNGEYTVEEVDENGTD